MQIINFLSILKCKYWDRLFTMTKEIPAYALVVGNPARQIGWMSEFGQRLNFDTTGRAICPESGQEYQLQNAKVERIQ